jgi:hypothetical protein
MIDHVVLPEAELWNPNVGDVFERSGIQVVDTQDPVAVGEQPFAQV